MKVLITDDEAPARERLRHLLDELADYTVIGEAADGREALRMCADAAADIVLLDIRMPGMDGLEAARHLAGLEHPPAVIFTTAYGDYALDAFNARAMGYLLKPIRKERLQEALAHAQRLTRAQLGSLAEAGGEPGARTHICAQLHGNLQLIPVGEIRYFRADQKYTAVRYPAGEVLIEDSLKALEQEFAGKFTRVHRSALVANEHLAGLEKSADGDVQVRLQGIDEGVEVSRRHLPELRRMLKRARGGG